MLVRVLREACCAQDDQMGPLEATYEVAPASTFGDLIASIVDSRFLQYSSSHVVLQGEVDGVPVVRVFSAHYTRNRPAEFFVDPGRPVDHVVGSKSLTFRFVFD